MRIQKVNESTLRIFLSFSELAERDISMTDLFQRSTKTEQLFWEMIAKAGEEVEFVLDEPFWIQATVMSGEEFVITVVKQAEPDEQTRDLKTKPKRRPRSTEWIYRFSDWEHLVLAVQQLGANAAPKSSIYFVQPDYYLVLSSRGITGAQRHKFEAVLKEFGEKVNTTKVYLQEYGKLIQADNALETIKRYF
ncbi:MAG: adaptor protein MecA [Peptococcaceae bacterium]|nr:adaptor protein MecA [Peptococcaceae bacterium]